MYYSRMFMIVRDDKHSIVKRVDITPNESRSTDLSPIAEYISGLNCLTLHVDVQYQVAL